MAAREYRVTQGTAWAVEVHGLLVRGPAGTRRIHYPAAAVWDLISRYRSFDNVVALIGPIAGLDEAQARALVRAALDDWVAAGYLEPVPDDG
jgi:hypothetical protein